MDTNEEIGLTQMRKSVENLGSSTDGYGEQTLMRFLIARSMDPQKAAKMFSQWQKWRAEMVPIGYISDSEVADELEAKKIYLQGLSKNGHPVMIVKVNKHFSSKDQVQFKKFVVHLLDKTIASAFRGREIGNEKLIGILDLQNITYSNVDARGLITGFQFLQAYYPERLATCYLLHMPQFFVTVWRFVCRFLEKATQEKIRIVRSEEEREEFIREVGEDVLPEEYGGRAKIVLLQDVAVNY
ncbi:SEC14 cytosolic factor isoform X1 [Nicotiana tabacum]|uniref:SEC14 cytosolic factor isoform X1 n=1 Tax=Nicotiana tabacum TaxID=4097 RepID=A0A1S4BYS2_TOBAC|nr:PREDICTED: SEC14 cytosolic factor-like isoform X1 [Nicotiana tabacum]